MKRMIFLCCTLVLCTSLAWAQGNQQPMQPTPMQDTQTRQFTATVCNAAGDLLLDATMVAQAPNGEPIRVQSTGGIWFVSGVAEKTVLDLKDPVQGSATIEVTLPSGQALVDIRWEGKTARAIVTALPPPTPFKLTPAPTVAPGAQPIGGDRQECPPGSLFDQPPTPSTGGWTAGVSDLRTGSGYSSLIRYEDFSGGGEICDIHFFGLTLSYPWAACTEDPMDFEVIFYNDDGGAPGDVECGPYYLTLSGTNTGESWSGFPVYEFAAILDPCCNMASGWVSIQATSVGSPTDCWFLWCSHGETGEGMSLLLDQGTGLWTTENFDLSLCLTGQPAYGACCDDYDGTCEDNVASIDCTTRFAADTLCADLDPPCGIYGACCVELVCVATTLESDCDAMGGSWYAGETCPEFECPATCEHTIVLTDDYGDGWNGGMVTVRVNNIPVLTNITLPSGYGPLTYYFQAATGDTIDTVYVPGSWAYENEYHIYDGGLGLEICADGVGGTQPTGGYCGLGNCLIPTTGACCDPDTGDCYPDMTQEDCAAMFPTGAFFLGLGCDPNPCPQPAPPNDDCDTAFPINAPYPQSVCGTNAGATIDCPGILDWHSTWWAIEMPYAMNNMVISFCGNGFEINNIGIVYYDECPVDCPGYIVYDGIDWYSCPDGVVSPIITWLDIPGPGTVWFPVYYNNDTQGPYCFEVNVTEVVVPENDLCENAMPVAVPSTTAGTTIGATVDTGFVLCGTSITAPGVWYSATGTGTTMTASLCNPATTWDTKLCVYCPECVDALCVGGNDDFCGVQSQVSWCSQLGANYLILVHGYSSYTGNFELDVYDDGSPCTGAVKCLPEGACCLLTGECVITNELYCNSVGGWFLGEDTDCGIPVGGKSRATGTGTHGPTPPAASLNWTFGGSSGDRDDPTCPPGSLFDQPPTPATGGWTAGVSDLRTGSGYSSLIRYEDFSGGGEICDIHFWGLTLSYPWAACSEDPMDFEVIFYNDDGGAPGDVVCGPYYLTLSGTPTGELWSGFPQYEYAAMLDPCCTLGAGWVSIQATSVGSPTDCWFLWCSHGETGDGMSLLLDQGTGLWTTEVFDLSLCLTGEPAYGACCDDYTGVCEDNVASVDCTTRFVADTLCADLDPPCGILGACCVGLECVATNLESECDAIGGTWYAGETCPEFVCPATCEHSITMWDSYGDGWNGCTINVYVNGELEQGGITLPSGAGPGYAYFDAATGDEIFIDFICVSWCSEPSYCVYDAAGVELGCAVGGYNPGDGDLTVTGECYDTPGACCFPDGSCEDLMLAECEAAGGFYGGTGTTCATYECPMFLGACCLPDHSCVITNVACCEYAGGQFVGGGTECGEPIDETINLLTWTSDHSPYGPGEPVAIGIGAYAGATARVEFRYYGDSWDWYAQVDNVVVGDISEDFNAGIPAGWTRTDNAGAGWMWELNTTTGRMNYAGGDGTCMCADSDYWYSYPYDTSLITPEFVIPTGGTLEFIAAYNYLGAGEAFQVNIMVQAPGGLNPCQYLDIKPGSCPNPLNVGSRGVIPIALVGMEDFDVTQVDLETLRLARMDGLGGEVAPNFGPPGPYPTFEDVATPFYGVLCDCHELTGDGIVDLMMHFRRTNEVAEVLNLGPLGAGGYYKLYVKGNMLDGSPFVAPDCVMLVGHGASGPFDPLFGQPMP